MIDFKKIRLLTGDTQQEMAEILGVSQGAYSKIEKGVVPPSIHLVQRAIDCFTPSVYFINHGNYAPLICNSMKMLGQIDLVAHEIEPFIDALKKGQKIAVITNNKAPFISSIEKALSESSLPAIPMRGIWVDKNKKIKIWRKMS